MARQPYATPEALAAWLGTPAPADAERLIARAGEDIDSALLTAVYRVDEDGDPTEPDIAAALSAATCAQVEWWLATGDDGSGAADRWGSVSIGPVSLSDRKTSAAGASGVELAPRARRALRRAGLEPGRVFAW
ncbi:MULTISPECIES: hypothetical protein [unclassified Streptomyces]|uniref:hypothetical protein n=1 Tax=unclassified Streptomyces TaxID=2593676 RepID=UPI0006B04725|nr:MULTISPECIES: hypothetical protein [unclassified Streptomyces]KOX16570.1 hypothetical protein ADL06_33255 [Streptomyces sp. NRRL F-6491]KOX36102.1 hypothetical protein ADL08_33485 [Streptomyces sp. NRRL F-6492]